VGYTTYLGGVCFCCAPEYDTPPCYGELGMKRRARVFEIFEDGGITSWKRLGDDDLTTIDVQHFFSDNNPQDPSDPPGVEPQSPNSNDAKLSTVEVTGIIMGIIAGVALIVSAFVFLKKQNANPQGDNKSESLIPPRDLEGSSNKFGLSTSATVLSGV
jgi:hypothetical protein